MFSISFGKHQKERLFAGSCTCEFSVVRNYQTLYLSACSILHSYWYWVKVPVAPYSRQHLTLSVLQTLAILTGVEWFCFSSNSFVVDFWDLFEVYFCGSLLQCAEESWFFFFEDGEFLFVLNGKSLALQITLNKPFPKIF